MPTIGPLGVGFAELGTASTEDIENFADASDTTDALALKAPAANPTFTGDVVVPDANAATEALNRQTGDARYVQLSLFDAAGDLLVGTGADTVARLAKGTALQILRVNSGATALEWATPSSAGDIATDVLWDAAADLAVGTGANTAARLAKGTALQTLRVNSGATALEWATLTAAGVGALADDDDVITVDHIAATGSPGSGTFLRGDMTWSSAGGGEGGGAIETVNGDAGPDVVLDASDVGAVGPGTADSVDAMGLIVPDDSSDDLVSGIIIKSPSATWGEDGETAPGGDPLYGTGQFMSFHKEGAGDASDNLLFRIDRTGGLGTTGGIHVATGLRQRGGYTATQCMALTPHINAAGLVINSPDPASLPTGWDTSFLTCVDVRDSNRLVFDVAPTGVNVGSLGGLNVTGGWAAVSGSAFGIGVFIQPPNTTDKGLIVRGQASHSGNLLEAQSSASALLFAVGPTGAVTGLSAAVTGKTGAAATPITLAGGTASGAPSSGAHVKGEVVFDDAGSGWYCTVAGTPGTWVTLNAVAFATKQATHANLTAVAGLSLIADRLPYANGTGTLALTTFTAAGRALVDDADADAQLATLGAVDRENGGLETVVAHGSTGSTETIDLAGGNYHTATQDEACTYTFTGATSGKACSFTLELSSVTGAATWPASVDWPDATAPTLSGKTVITFVTTDGGTTWLGFPGGKAFA